MSKLLIALGVVFALSAPAAAGRLDVDLRAADGVAQINEGVSISGAQSFAPVEQESTSAAERVRDLHLFGADGR